MLRRLALVSLMFVSLSCGGGTPLGDGGAAGSGGGLSCGTKTCPAGGTCCHACISECVGPGGTCPQYLVDPCSNHDGGAQACTSESPTCPAGRVCDFNQANRCTATTVVGTCIVKPDVCAQNDAPVCGCDAKTYANDCERQAARVQLEHTGACT